MVGDDFDDLTNMQTKMLTLFPEIENIKNYFVLFLLYFCLSIIPSKIYQSVL